MVKVMTPKEKAKEIINEMYAAHTGSASFITLYFSQKCALIAVNNIISVINSDTDFKQWKFYKEVKKEIEDYEYIHFTTNQGSPPQKTV